MWVLSSLINTIIEHITLHRPVHIAFTTNLALALSLHSTQAHHNSPHFTTDQTSDYTTVHYTTLHHTKPHDTTVHYTTLHYTTVHYTTLHYTTLHYTTLHYTTPHKTTRHYTTLHYTTLHYTTLHYTTLHYTTLNNITLTIELTWRVHIKVKSVVPRKRVLFPKARRCVRMQNKIFCYLLAWNTLVSIQQNKSMKRGPKVRLFWSILVPTIDKRKPILVTVFYLQLFWLKGANFEFELRAT